VRIGITLANPALPKGETNPARKGKKKRPMKKELGKREGRGKEGSKKREGMVKVHPDLSSGSGSKMKTDLRREKGR